MLHLLSQVCDEISNSAVSLEKNAGDYKTFLKVICWRIRSLPIPTSQDYDPDFVLTMQLYQLAILLHFNRSFEGLIDQPFRMQELIDSSFAILSRLKVCTQQFPLHVVGCEARTDEQRAVVLDVISRTEKMSSSRSFYYCKRILEAVWAQNDLASADEINIGYRDKLTRVMSHCASVPSFV